MNNPATTPSIVTLASHIKDKHQGNRSSFARCVGVSPQLVAGWLKSKKPYFVIDGKVVQLVVDFNDMRLNKI